MRYYNENPQVAYWMSKCATLQQELDMVREKLEEVEESRDFWKQDSNNTLQNVFNYFKKFNALPWYKKMFFKFKL